MNSVFKPSISQSSTADTVNSVSELSITPQLYQTPVSSLSDLSITPKVNQNSVSSVSKLSITPQKIQVSSLDTLLITKKMNHSIVSSLDRLSITSANNQNCVNSSDTVSITSKINQKTVNGINKPSLKPKVNLAIAMQRHIGDYSTMVATEATETAFEEAVERITDIRHLTADQNSLELHLDDIIADDMAHVVFGSNKVERVGCGYDETMKLCGEIFKSHRRDLGSIEPRHPDYQARLDTIIGKHPPRRTRERREVVNHAAAFIHITNAIVKRDEPLTEALIKETHRILCTGIDAEGAHGKSISSARYAGIYRSVPVMAGNAGFVPPRFVAKNMAEFIEDLSTDLAAAEAEAKLDPFYIAAKACDTFVNIHPFLDGNGRTCRLILNSILLRYAGIVAPIGEHDQDRMDYLKIAKRRSRDEHGPGELALFTLKKGLASLKNMTARLKGKAGGKA